MATPTRLICVVVSALSAACYINRPLSVAPQRGPVAEYLASHPHAVLYVIDSAGNGRWLHHPSLDGDTLRGRPTQDFTERRLLAIPLSQVASLAVPQFSAGRTAGLMGGLVAATGVAVIIFVPEPPRPITVNPADRVH